VEPWRRILETIKKDFNRWEARYPTLEGKRHVVQMIAGGKTQFLTRAQGMPESVQTELQKMISSFVWGKERATMNIRHMSKNPEHGGRKIMDVVRRNQAIDLTWVKQYMNMGPDRPKWAYMMDEIFRTERPKKAKETHQMVGSWNPLTQDWKPKANSNYIPKRVQNAMRLAGTHAVDLEALEPNEETKRELPVWLHRKANREAARLYTTSGAKCLKSKHKTHYMRQLVEMIDDIPKEHRKMNFCTCELCKKASTLGCTHPNKCFESAEALLNTLAPKWRPGSRQRCEGVIACIPQTAASNHSEGIKVDTTREATDLGGSMQIFTTKEN
jgi:hypothetical protein